MICSLWSWMEKNANFDFCIFKEQTKEKLCQKTTSTWRCFVWENVTNRSFQELGLKIQLYKNLFLSLSFSILSLSLSLSLSHSLSFFSILSLTLSLSLSHTHTYTLLLNLSFSTLYLSHDLSLSLTHFFLWNRQQT